MHHIQVVYNTYMAFASAVVTIVGAHTESTDTMNQLHDVRRRTNVRFSQISKVYGKRGRKPIKLIDHF